MAIQKWCWRHHESMNLWFHRDSNCKNLNCLNKITCIIDVLYIIGEVWNWACKLQIIWIISENSVLLNYFRLTINSRSKLLCVVIFKGIIDGVHQTIYLIFTFLKYNCSYSLERVWLIWLNCNIFHVFIILRN